jgi:hypothetical protein
MNVPLSVYIADQGLHYQSFCDHSRNFAYQFAQTFLTNPSKLRIYLRKIPTVITETLTM